MRPLSINSTIKLISFGTRRDFVKKLENTSRATDNAIIVMILVFIYRNAIISNIIIVIIIFPSLPTILSSTLAINY